MTSKQIQEKIDRELARYREQLRAPIRIETTVPEYVDDFARRITQEVEVAKLFRLAACNMTIARLGRLAVLQLEAEISEECGKGCEQVP